MPEPLLLIVQCKGCGLWINATSGEKPNAPGLLRCGCCSLEHDHDEAAEASGVPCRPIHITVVSPIALELGAGQPQSSVFSDGMTIRPGPDDVPALLSRGGIVREVPAEREN